MIMAARKRARRTAFAIEQQRRWQQAEAASPVTRDQLNALIDHLSERVLAVGHDGTFDLTRTWLTLHALPAEPVLEFLRTHHASCDFDVFCHCDPCALFGPTPDRLARMPVDRPTLEALQDFLDKRVSREGCDNTTRFTEEWLTTHHLPVASTLTALLAQGGGCDCEVVMNVEPERVYPPSGAGAA